MSIVLFWIRSDDSPASMAFKDSELSCAMRLCELHRRQGMRHVTISSELSSNIGKPGVDSVLDGKTPDGVDYDWDKAHRIGKMKESDRTGKIKSYIEP